MDVEVSEWGTGPRVGQCTVTCSVLRGPARTRVSPKGQLVQRVTTEPLAMRTFASAQNARTEPRTADADGSAGSAPRRACDPVRSGPRENSERLVASSWKDGTIVKLHKIKRPAGDFCFEVELVEDDTLGSWLYGQCGSAWTAPHDSGTLPFDVLVLLSPERHWVAWWVDDPGDPRLEIDVCLPPERVDDGWRYVDLELDPVRHERGAIEIEDWDEFTGAIHAGWIDPAEAAIAEQTALLLDGALRERSAPLGNEGWQRLDRLR